MRRYGLTPTQPYPYPYPYPSPNPNPNLNPNLNPNRSPSPNPSPSPYPSPNQVLPPKAVVDCLQALASANLCAMSATSPASPKQLGRPDSAGTGALVPDEGPELAGDLPEIAGDYPAFGRGSGALAAEEPHPQERIGEMWGGVGEIWDM